MRTCAILSCDSNPRDKNVHLFRAPKDKEEAKGWIDFVTEANSGTLPVGHIYICSKHFRKCCLYPNNPSRTTLIAGHYPSIVDGKVIINGNSKCALLSDDENLEIYTTPTHQSVHEKQRAYLVKQLTSFGVQRRIVIGSGKESPIMEKLRENRCEIETVERSNSPPEKNLSHAQEDLVLDVNTGNKNVHLFINTTGAGKNFDEVTLRNQEIVKQEASDIFELEKRKSTCPSSETQIKLLTRDKSNLKKLVKTLEKRVEELEKEIKKHRQASSELESQYMKILGGLKARLKQKNEKVSRDFGTQTDVTDCKCRPIEFIDISADD